MEKIPSLLERDFTTGAKTAPVTGRITPGTEWALTDPAGVARRKWDGTCVRCIVTWKGGVRTWQWFTRRMVRFGADAPPGFRPAESDERTGKVFGWEPAEQSPYAVPLDEAIASLVHGVEGIHDGTYELVGPKINGNPGGLDRHFLMRHATAQELVRAAWSHPGLDLAGNLERACNAIAFVGEGLDAWEGVVFYGPDGRRAKLKARDVAEARRLGVWAA